MQADEACLLLNYYVKKIMFYCSLQYFIKNLLHAIDCFAAEGAGMLVPGDIARKLVAAVYM